MAKKIHSEWDVHPSVAMVTKWVAELPAKTGRSLEEWSTVVKGLKQPDMKAKRDYMKREYGLGTMGAWLVVEYTLGLPTWDGDPVRYLANAPTYVEKQYAGAKAALKPMLDEIITFGRSLGADVKVCPCKTMVPLYRKRVFAEVRAATKTRMELALALEDTPIAGKMKLNPRAKGNDRLRHLFELFSPDDLTAEVKKAVKRAYIQDA